MNSTQPVAWFARRVADCIDSRFICLDCEMYHVLESSHKRSTKIEICRGEFGWGEPTWILFNRDKDRINRFPELRSQARSF